MAATETNYSQPERRHCSVFELPANFFDSCRLLPSPLFLLPDDTFYSSSSAIETLNGDGDGNGERIVDEDSLKNNAVVPRLSCNTCGKAEFESLVDQRFHFKSDYHRFNVKLSVAGKDIVKEEDFDELTSDSLFKDFDVSSISGSDDEVDKDVVSRNNLHKGASEGIKQKLFFQLKNGERISLWKCLLMSDPTSISFDNDTSSFLDDRMCLGEREVVEKLKNLIHEPRNSTHIRIVLLASGGHFAGCVFDGNQVVAHKTFHRYVIRAKSGRKQSSKDATGKAASSAGASLRRYNELALKKEIQDLLAGWKPYFDASSIVFISVTSSNRKMLHDGEKPFFSCPRGVVQTVPLTVKRPTLKEARRIYSQLTQILYEVDERQCLSSITDSTSTNSIIMDGQVYIKKDLGRISEVRETAKACSPNKEPEEPTISSGNESELLGKTTPLHEAAKCGNADKVLELLEQGLDPCIKDERGRTPYMLANEKEARNMFRRFMALNLDKWDWLAAQVPSPLTKEMEESQAAKQAEKDAKKKARAKEHKKLRKAKEKKDQVQALASESATISSPPTSLPILKGHSSSSGSRPQISKEEELKRAQASEREKRAAAAEKRLAAGVTLSAQGTSTSIIPSTSQPPNIGASNDVHCSCCEVSLAGMVPFHRYNYKYCSTSCMHVHKQYLEEQ